MLQDLANLAAGSPFVELATLLVLAAIIGFVGLQLRQPLIVSFIVVGLLAGPAGLGIARSQDQIDLLAQLGVAVLLFLVGAKLDVKLIRALGVVAVTTGLGHVLFTSVFGFLIGLALGFDWLTSLYMAVALTFSSTIIIVKLLSDKREIDSLHGQVALGFLIVQDLFVVFSMVVLSTIGFGAGADAGAWPVIRTFLLAALLLLLVIGFVRYLADPLTERLAKAPELLVTFTLGLTAMMAAVADGIGLGKEIGGLLAGVALASTPYRETITARLAPLRDFLLLFFFIALGVHLDLSLIGGNIAAAAAFSLFVLIGNPLIVLSIMGAMGYRKRTGFLAGLTVAQISEFSLIFMAMGVSLGHVGAEALGLVTLVGLITIAASTYMITYSHQLYALFAPLLGPFERRGTPREREGAAATPKGAFDVMLFGHGRFGSAIARGLREAGLRTLCVDFNPGELRRARKAGFPVCFGDASDPAFVADLPLAGVRWVVATMPAHARGVTHDDPRLSLLQSLAGAGFAGRIAVMARDPLERAVLLEAGADVVFEPFEDAADRALEILLGRQAGEEAGPEAQPS